MQWSPRRPIVKSFLAVVLVIASVFASAEPRWEVSYQEPKGFGSSGHRPVTVTVVNRGAPENGVLELSGGSVRERTPVRLETGTTRHTIDFPRHGDYFNGELILTTPGARVLAGMSGREYVPTNTKAIFVMEIRSFDAKERAHGIDATLKPADAPRRATGYESLDAVILGEGARALDATQGEALRRWVMGGGSLGFYEDTDLAPTGLTEGRVGLGLVRRVTPSRPQQDLAVSVGRTRAERLLTSVGEFPEVRPSGVPTSEKVAARDPFQASLPPVSNVAYILIGYLVLVLPINFLVLKKAGRAHWAWVTAPVLGLIFAGLFSRTTRSLSAAPLAQATRGVIVAQDGVAEGIFEGKTQYFVPQAGSRDPDLKDAIRVGRPPQAESGYYLDTPVTTVERPSGSSVPTLVTNNLAFGELSYRAPVKGAGMWFKVSGERASFLVRNDSPHTMKGGRLRYAKLSAPVPPLAPGQSAWVKLTPVPLDPDAMETPYADEDTAVLSGSLKDIVPGPRIGREVPGRALVKIVQLTRVLR